jgi:hypothetical protein
MKKIIFIHIGLIFSLTRLPAQQDSAFRLVKTIKADIASFTVDHLDNIYLLNSSNQLKKLNNNGDSVSVFNDIRKFGKVTYVDVSNPLRVLLYYKDFATVVVLDRLLNVRSTIDLRQQNIFQVQAVGLSYDNKIWLYDELENKLKKIDEDGRLLFETADFRQLFNEAFSFSSVYDQDGLLYLYDKQKGVFVFDYYGALKNKIALTGWDNFKVAGNYLFGRNHDSLFRYQPALFLQQHVLLPESFSKAAAISFTFSRVYALKKDDSDGSRIEIYLLR